MSILEVDINWGAAQPVPVSSTYEPAPGGLAVAANVGGGTFAAGTYYWVVTATDASGETTASNEVSVAVALNGTATLTWPADLPAATGYKVYRGTAPGAENALIATLGNVLTYTDTGTAGSGASPPGSNTAQIGNQLIFGGDCRLTGFSFRETSGSASASLAIQSPGQTVVNIVMAQGTTANQGYGDNGIDMRGGIILHVNSGVFTGTVFVKYAR